MVNCDLAQFFEQKWNAPTNALQDRTLRRKTTERDVTLSDGKMNNSHFVEISVRFLVKGFAPLTLRAPKN